MALERETAVHPRGLLLVHILVARSKLRWLAHFLKVILLRESLTFLTALLNNEQSIELG